MVGNFALNVCFQDAAAGLNSCGTLNVAPTPEPGTFGFIGLAFAGLAVAHAFSADRSGSMLTSSLKRRSRNYAPMWCIITL